MAGVTSTFSSIRVMTSVLSAGDIENPLTEKVRINEGNIRPLAKGERERGRI